MPNNSVVIFYIFVVPIAGVARVGVSAEPDAGEQDFMKKSVQSETEYSEAINGRFNFMPCGNFVMKLPKVTAIPKL
jgi:hypothetical protein